MIWAAQLRRKKSYCHCDNLDASHAWANLGSKCRNVLVVMRAILATAAEFNFTLAIRHIQGCDNSLADVLSRFQNDKFHRLAPHAAKTPKVLPDFLKQLKSLMVHPIY